MEAIINCLKLIDLLAYMPIVNTLQFSSATYPLTLCRLDDDQNISA